MNILKRIKIYEDKEQPTHYLKEELWSVTKTACGVRLTTHYKGDRALFMEHQNGNCLLIKCLRKDRKFQI